MFKVKRNPVDTLWVPMDTTSQPTLYVGQLVKSTGDGVGAMAVASGVADTSNLQVIAGVVAGTNNRTPVYNSTYSRDSIGSVITQAEQAARDFFGQEGQWSKGDPQAFVQIHKIDAHTVMEAPLYNSTIGTAPTLLTATVGSTSGLGFTSNACDVTPVADLVTSYCRTGANRNIMRISDDTSTTVETNDVAFPNDIAIGDTFIRVPLRPFGQSYVQINSTSGAVGLFFDISQTPATNYFIIDVLELDLSIAGQEKVLFTFHPCHFDKVRA